MNVDLITRIATAAIGLGVQYLTAGRTRDAEALAAQLEALRTAPRADVDSIEAEALRRLRQDEPTQTSPVGRFPQPVLDMGERPRIAPDFPGDLDGGE